MWTTCLRAACLFFLTPAFFLRALLQADSNLAACYIKEKKYEKGAARAAKVAPVPSSTSRIHCCHIATQKIPLRPRPRPRACSVHTVQH